MTETSELIAGQRLASQHFPSTWTPEAQFELELWTWHDGHKHENNFAVCVTCMTLMAEWHAERQAEQVAVYDLAKELGV